MSFFQVLRRTRKALRGKEPPKPASLFHFHTQTYWKTLFAYRFFYVCYFAMGIGYFVPSSEKILTFDLNQPVFPLFLLGLPTYKAIVVNSANVLFVLSTAAAMFWPLARTARILVCFTLISVIGLRYSNGIVGNDLHMLIYPAFFLIFAPSGKGHQKSRAHRHLTIMWFWAAQLGIILSYQMAGLTKILGIFNCINEYGFSGCELGAGIFANLIGKEKLLYNWQTFDGDLFLHYPLIGSLLYYGVIWLFSISVFFAFRFQLHRFFLFSRGLFHFGTLVIIGIGFPWALLATAAVFTVSPFSRTANFKEVLSSLPPLGWLSR